MNCWIKNRNITFLAVIRLSQALQLSSFSLQILFLVQISCGMLSMSENKGGSICGECPRCSLKGENPVD